MDAHKTLRHKLLTIVEGLLGPDGHVLAGDTYQRLLLEGFSEETTKTLIAQCVAIEYLEGKERLEDFDQDRFVRNLDKLPRPPYEEESDTAYGTGEDEFGSGFEFED